MLGTCRLRLRQGWAAAQAVSTPKQQGHRLTAWGETKAPAEWAPQTLLWRFRQGWEPESVVAGR